MSRLLFHPLSLIIITILGLIFSYSLYQSSQKYVHSSQNLAISEQNIAQEQQAIEQVKNELNQANLTLSEEKIIRDELLQQSPGEYVVQIPNLDDLPEPTPPTSQELTPWQSWRQLLFGQ